MKYLTPSGMKK